jgi:hypothetical protein
MSIWSAVSALQRPSFPNQQKPGYHLLKAEACRTLIYELIQYGNATSTNLHMNTLLIKSRRTNQSLTNETELTRASLSTLRLFPASSVPQVTSWNLSPPPWPKTNHSFKKRQCQYQWQAHRRSLRLLLLLCNRWEPGHVLPFAPCSGRTSARTCPSPGLKRGLPGPRHCPRLRTSSKGADLF